MVKDVGADRALVSDHASYAVDGPTGFDHGEVMQTLYQYESDLLYPPTGDSLQRRLERVRSVIAKASGDGGSAF